MAASSESGVRSGGNPAWESRSGDPTERPSPADRSESEARHIPLDGIGDLLTTLVADFNSNDITAATAATMLAQLEQSISGRNSEKGYGQLVVRMGAFRSILNRTLGSDPKPQAHGSARADVASHPSASSELSPDITQALDRVNTLIQENAFEEAKTLLDDLDRRVAAITNQHQGFLLRTRLLLLRQKLDEKRVSSPITTSSLSVGSTRPKVVNNSGVSISRKLRRRKLSDANQNVFSTSSGTGIKTPQSPDTDINDVEGPPELVNWKALRRLVPATRIESQDEEFWRSRLAQLRRASPTYAEFFQKGKLLSLRTEQKLNLLRDALNEEYFILLRNGRSGSVQNELETLLNQIDLLIKPPNARTMTLEQIVAEITSYGIYQNQERILNLRNAFEERLTDTAESEQPKRSRLINLLATTDAAVAATSQKADFAANVNRVISPFAGANGSITTIALGYFFKGEDDKFDVRDAIAGRVEVDERMIQLWEYMRARIAHKPEHGGIPQATARVGDRIQDSTGGYIPKFAGESSMDYQSRLTQIANLDQTFSYSSLNEQVVDDFKEHLHLIFKDIPEQKRASFILFCQTFGIKSAAYMPWLMRGATRGHGFKPNEQEKSDESRYVNPFALRLYQATRYDSLTFARFLSIFLLVDKDKFLEIVEQNKDTKVEEAEEYYELIEWYMKSKWGTTLPPWLLESRSMFIGPEPKVDLNGSIFPLLPEVFVNTLGVERQRDYLLRAVESGRITESSFNELADKFVEKYQHQGYFPKYKKLLAVKETGDRRAMLKLMRGRMNFFASGDENNPSANLDLVQYQLAAAAVEKMFDTFDKPVSMGMTKEQIIKAMLDWNNSIIGKAKLVPGPHQQLFAPLTCLLLSNLFYAYDHSGVTNEVDSLYREMMKRLQDPAGLPEFVSEEVIRTFGGNKKKAPAYLVHKSHLKESGRYNTLLNRHQTKYEETLGAKVGRSIGIRLARQRHSPFEFEEEVSKDTTDTSKNGGGH